jgi:Peptidase family M28
VFRMGIVLSLLLFPRAGTPGASAKEGAPRADPKLASALKQISGARIRADIDKLVSFQTRLTLSAQDRASIEAGRGIGAAREWIKAEFESYSRECGGCLEVKTDVFTESRKERIPDPTVITNVYAVLKGRDLESEKRIVLVTGHYDSRNSDTLDATGMAPGANDDASGTAVSLECARVLSRMKFPATMVFLTVAGEEQGLNGSQHFAEMAKAQGWNIEAALNNDIVGGDRNPQQDPSVVRVFSEGVPISLTDNQLNLIRNLGGESDSPSREVARYVEEVGRTYQTGVKPLLVFRLDRYLRGGDHSSFNQQGYAAVRFTEFREDYNHQHHNVRSENGIEYGDLSKFVNFDYVAAVARLNAATLASIASSPAPPVKVRLAVKELENDSTLSWGAPSEGHAADYEVLWRSTQSAEWEHVKAVGSVTRTTLPLSKDNVIFAVRTVDREGHRSLPVVPLPEK